jgi:hypothetical protein
MRLSEPVRRRPLRNPARSFTRNRQAQEAWNRERRLCRRLRMVKRQILRSVYAIKSETYKISVLSLDDSICPG